MIHYAKKTLKRAWMVSFARLRKCSSSNRLPIQILSFDTGNPSAGAAVGDQSDHDASGRLSNQWSDYIVVGHHAKLRILLQLIMLSRMNGTKTEMRNRLLKNKRRILWHAKKISLYLLKIQAVALNQKSSSWASGIKSPIYTTDNRVTLAIQKLNGENGLWSY